VEFADKILIFAVLERRLLQFRETEASFCFYNKVNTIVTIPLPVASSDALMVPSIE